MLTCGNVMYNIFVQSGRTCVRNHFFLPGALGRIFSFQTSLDTGRSFCADQDVCFPDTWERVRKQLIAKCIGLMKFIRIASDPRESSSRNPRESSSRNPRLVRNSVALCVRLGDAWGMRVQFASQSSCARMLRVTFSGMLHS